VNRALKILLALVGLFFVAGIYPLITSVMHPKQSDYPDQMMLAIYVTLGVFLLLAIRNPAANRSLIAFTGWSSLLMRLLWQYSPSNWGTSAQNCRLSVWLESSAWF
jgi:succinate-acetate transporter protein